MQDLPEFDGQMAGWPSAERVEYAASVPLELHKIWTIALATNAMGSDEEQFHMALHGVGLDRFFDRVYC
jgi:FMN phosphatase YigB (HAD superfamily)